MTLAASLWCVAALLSLACIGVVAGRRPAATNLVYGAALLLTAALFALALRHLLGVRAPETQVLPLGLPWLGAHFRIDALSAVFLCIVNLGAAAASLYALGYGRHESAPQRVLPFYGPFLAGMNLVVLADDAFSFLLSWEFMSLASWALVMAHHRGVGNARAGFVYIVMASVGTLALLLAFGLLAGPEGRYAFADMRAAAPPAWLAGLVLGLVLFGAGSKAGLVPLHVWLPLAHPAAPSHVSALMSGVMTKVAVYGFVRVVFELLGPPAWWWALAVLAIGGLTAVLGVLHALMQTDLKRVLAYSTIENIGFVFIGLGLALAFKASGLSAAAAVALGAALLHAFNHALFKSALFFGSGAVLVATGERDMEKMGGLIHRMPVTAVAMLGGSCAISALPPFNGFVSEWLTLQAILLSPQLPQWGLKLLVPAIGGVVALSATLAAACFIRIFGITFLGRPRSPAAAAAHEVDRWSQGAMIGLAGLCLVAGIVPGPLIDAMAPAVSGLVGSAMPSQTSIAWLSVIPVEQGRSSYNGLLVFAFIAASASIAVVAIHRLASDALRRSAAWDCGFPDPSPATEYTAGSFSQPIRRVFGTSLLAARERVDMPPPGDMQPARMTVTLRDLVWDSLYAPVVVAVSFAADRLNHLQFLTIRRYLSLVFLALVSLLLALAIWT